MTDDDFNGYLSRLHDDLEQGPFTMSKRAILNGVLLSLPIWFVIGIAFAAILWTRT